MKPIVPTSLRKPEQRLAARQMADALLRADARRQRAAAMPKPSPKKAPPVETGPRRLTLSDLKMHPLAARGGGV
jgi:hypothetical protein